MILVIPLLMGFAQLISEIASEHKQRSEVLNKRLHG